MRVRRHVVQAGPGAHDRRARAGGIAVREAAALVLDDRLVDDLVAPQRGAGSGIASRRVWPRRRKWKPVSSSTTIGRSAGRSSTGPTSTSWRQSGRTGSSGASSADARPHATTRTSCGTSRASTPSRTSTPRSAARRTSSRATSPGSATPSSRQSDRAEDVVGAEAADPAGVDVLDRHAEPALQLGAR